jgi:hypothetical protein
MSQPRIRLLMRRGSSALVGEWQSSEHHPIVHLIDAQLEYGADVAQSYDSQNLKFGGVMMVIP